MNRRFATEENGFALLLTLIVVGVTLAIGLSLLNVTLKQLILTGTARDSEMAFHAAYAGAECAQYYRVTLQDDFIDGGNAITLANCVEGAINDGTYTELEPSNPGEIYLYEFDKTWASGELCTEFDVYIIDARAEGSPVAFTFPNYESKQCEAGGICTAIFARGYNRACSEQNTIRTIQREVVLIY